MPEPSPVPMPPVRPGPGPGPVPMPHSTPPLGPPPTEPVFPYAEARAAIRAIDALLDDLHRASTQHRHLTGELILGGTFSGTARGRFEDRVIEAGQEVAPGCTAALQVDRDWLVHAIAAADLRQHQYETDLARWKAKRDAPEPVVAA
ncbi:hypothetical protein KSP35_12795 [Aquihabitans sp. G128]|uniref:hypothetical protein n=1 Tax=Aquihabitans sp. G128 TaxID=2849779 RepID=UPI001C20FB0C|nr:hypothetical protein [Aquihabitans sp. G128]QXC59285.1 hypothetical protein KSP35_12795 [Aquihabitans sp. G128]